MKRRSRTASLNWPFTVQNTTCLLLSRTHGDHYVKTFAVLKSLPCDIFPGAHGEYFGLKAKYEK